MDILITNNWLVYEEYRNRPNIEYIDTDLLGLFLCVRDYIHKGHKLLTHPLSGSVKPNETPYKSILISAKADGTDVQSVTILEECIATAQKFAQRDIPDRFLKDLQVVDLSLIQAVLVKEG